MKSSDSQSGTSSDKSGSDTGSVPKNVEGKVTGNSKADTKVTTDAETKSGLEANTLSSDLTAVFEEDLLSADVRTESGADIGLQSKDNLSELPEQMSQKGSVAPLESGLTENETTFSSITLSTSTTSEARVEPAKSGQVLVSARGTADGLILRLDARADEESLRESLKHFVAARRTFLEGNQVTLEWLGGIPEDATALGIESDLDELFHIPVKRSTVAAATQSGTTRSGDESMHPSAKDMLTSEEELVAMVSSPGARSETPSGRFLGVDLGEKKETPENSRSRGAKVKSFPRTRPAPRPLSEQADENSEELFLRYSAQATTFDDESEGGTAGLFGGVEFLDPHDVSASYDQVANGQFDVRSSLTRSVLSDEEGGPMLNTESLLAASSAFGSSSVSGGRPAGGSRQSSASGARGAEGARRGSSSSASPSFNPELWDQPDCRMLYHTLRSGERFETEHSVVVFGDVNAGAEVVAGGDIVILGALRGIAHAGAYEETGGGRVIFALQLRPTQLRIGSVISRGSEDTKQAAEIARVNGSIIVVEPYQPKPKNRLKI